MKHLLYKQNMNPKRWGYIGVVLGIIFLGVLLAGCEDGIFTTPTTNPLITPDKAYEIDTWGANSEVYEFTPKSHSGKTCVVFLLDNLKSASMQCFDKPGS